MTNIRTITVTVAVEIEGHPDADEIAQSVYEDFTNSPYEGQRSVEIVSVSQSDRAE
jgi:hypothetical protein